MTVTLPSAYAEYEWTERRIENLINPPLICREKTTLVVDHGIATRDLRPCGPQRERFACYREDFTWLVTWSAEAIYALFPRALTPQEQYWRD